MSATLYSSIVMVRTEEVRLELSASNFFILENIKLCRARI